MKSENSIEVKYAIEPFMYEDAKTFYESAQQLERSGSRLNKPYAVLLSLSIELLLKSFVVRQQFVVDDDQGALTKSKIRHATGHALDEIFNSLRHKQPQLGDLLISDYANRTQECLVTDLKKNARVFEQLRYTYPKHGSALDHGHAVYVDALESVSKFLVDVGEEILVLQTKGSALHT
jgi:hypothetical protein